MSIKDIIQAGNPLIRVISKPILQFESSETRECIQHLIDMMHTQNLIGLSAIQLGYPFQIFVTEIRNTEYRKPKDSDILRIFINPEILTFSRETNTLYEWCGSIAYSGLFAPVKRSEKISIRAYGWDGTVFHLEADGFLARVIQHEYDHLRWILFTDRIDDMREIMSVSEYKKQVVSGQ